MPKLLQMRAGQRRFFRMVDDYRVCAFAARRQYGKTTTFAKIALKKMMKKRDHTVIFGSAKLSLSREIIRTEARVMQQAIQAAVAEIDGGESLLQVVDSASARVPDKLSPDDFAELFEAQRMEFRLFHDRTSYSRTKIVALHPDTVGETGDLMCDELRAIKNWREVWEAVHPIIASNPEFRCTLSTTVPTDDAHYAYTQLLPPVGMEFEPNPEGNIYESQGGIMVCRVDAWDAALDGVPLYDDKTGEPLTPEESRRKAQDKDAWDRNYGMLFIAGGSAACGLTQIDTAQRRGIGKCRFVLVDTDTDFDNAVNALPGLLGKGRVGVGVDLATTTKAKSNPTAVAIAEEDGIGYIFPLIVAWKTADPNLAEDRIRLIVEAVAKRETGGRAKALAVDATNERYFAQLLKDRFASLLPVNLVVGSETIALPGREPITKKQHHGGVLIAELNDNHLTLPPERYVRDDWRLVKNDRGALVCEPDYDGKHGDTFDGAKLAISALKEGGPVEIAAAKTSGLPSSFSVSHNGHRTGPAFI